MKKNNILLVFILLSFFGQGQVDIYKDSSNIDRSIFKENRDVEPINHRLLQQASSIETQKGSPDAILAPANDNCASATALTINGGCLGGQTTSLATVQAGECLWPGTCCTTWYRFNTGANTSLNLAWIYTNAPICCPAITIYGPFAAGGGCLPSCVTPTALDLSCQNGDPGYHPQLTGLTTSSDYLIQIAPSTSSGSCNSSVLNYCIGMYTVPANDIISGATNLNSCGVSFNANNNGYSADGTGPRSANLDANAATTCGACLTAGDDVPYVINNNMWFYFCSVNAGTYNIVINNIANCVLPAPNSGIQSSILLGPTTAFTNLYDFPNPMAPGTSNTSANFTLAAGDCVYMPVDGFAGDQCTYSFTLNNVSGGCLILPIELLKFDMKIESKEINLFWETATEINNDLYILQRSTTGSNYVNIGTVKSLGNTNVPTNYNFIDKNPNRGINYYRLMQIDKNGKTNEIGNAIAKFYSNLANYVNVFTGSESSSLTIELGNTFPAGNYALSFYNMLGEKVHSSSITQVDNTAGNFTIDISSLRGGIYSCTLEGGYDIFVKKTFVKN